MNRETLSRLSRVALQRLAKKSLIKANLKSVDIIALLLKKEGAERDARQTPDVQKPSEGPRETTPNDVVRQPDANPGATSNGVTQRPSANSSDIAPNAMAQQPIVNSGEMASTAAVQQPDTHLPEAPASALVQQPGENLLEVNLAVVEQPDVNRPQTTPDIEPKLEPESVVLVERTPSSFYERLVPSYLRRKRIGEWLGQMAEAGTLSQSELHGANNDNAISEAPGFDGELDSRRDVIISLGEYINKTSDSVYQRRRALGALREKLRRLSATLRSLRAQRRRVYVYARHWQEIPPNYTREELWGEGESCSSATSVSFDGRRAEGISLPSTPRDSHPDRASQPRAADVHDLVATPGVEREDVGSPTGTNPGRGGVEGSDQGDGVERGAFEKATKRTRTEVDDDTPSKRARVHAEEDNPSLQREWAKYSALMKSACNNLLQLHSAKERLQGGQGYGCEDGDSTPSNGIQQSRWDPIALQGVYKGHSGYLNTSPVYEDPASDDEKENGPLDATHLSGAHVGSPQPSGTRKRCRGDIEDDTTPSKRARHEDLLSDADKENRLQEIIGQLAIPPLSSHPEPSTNISSGVSKPLAGRKRRYSDLDWNVPPEWPVKRRCLALSESPEEDEIILIPGLLSEKAKGKRKMTQEQMDEDERRNKELQMEWERQCELEAEAEERAARMELDEALARKMQEEYDDGTQKANGTPEFDVQEKKSSHRQGSVENASPGTFPVSIRGRRLEYEGVYEGVPNGLRYEVFPHAHPERTPTPPPPVLDSEQITNDSCYGEETQSEWDGQTEVEIGEEEFENHLVVESHFAMSAARDEK